MISVIHRAKIYTLNSEQPQASALAVRDEKILAVGGDELLNEFSSAQLVDLEGKTILPGLTDAHIHLENYSLGLAKIDCETASREECLRRVAERARATPPGEWLLGHGWNQNNWPEGYGQAVDLDAVAPRHPVYLTAKSLHAAWANTAALRLAGISPQTDDPVDGRLGRDARGQPDGLLFESAMQLVFSAIPEPSVEAVARAIQIAQPSLLRLGLTGLHDFDRGRCFSALQTLRLNQELKIRVLKSLPKENLAAAAELGLRSGFGDDWLRIGSVKIFADGALGPHTAAMLAPYEGEADNRGMLMVDAEELFEIGRAAAQAGFSLAVHAIGDRANHEVLDGLAHLREYESEQGFAIRGKRLRHRIEHVQLIHAEDAERFARLGIVASMQPIHATSDMLMADRFWGGRAALAYAWREQLRHGATLAFGSDAPVESPNPFLGLHAALTRRRTDGSPGALGWYPEQRLNFLEALQGFTTGPAYTAGMEDRLGRLAPGYLADLIVLEMDPFTCPADEIHALKPWAVMVGGEWAWE
jgi:hypothetical protein